MLSDPDIRKIGLAAVDSGMPRITYADCRIFHITEEDISVATGSIDALKQSESFGIGLRVLADGAWGFASIADVTLDSVADLQKRAVEIARASAILANEPVELANIEPHSGEFKTKILDDPFAIPLKEKLAYVTDLDALIRADEALNHSSAHLFFRREYRYFFSSEGHQIKQEIYQSGAGITAGIVHGHGQSFERSYPTSGGQYEAAGYELVERLSLESGIEKIAEEAKAVATASECPNKTGTVILSGDLTSLQVHESIGHPLELDRVYGSERNFSGTSFATPEQLGKLKYASDIVTVVTNPTAEGGLGSFGFDDEGTPAMCAPLIEKGVLVGYLNSRETAARLGVMSNGSLRAKSWAHLPIVRMTNTNLLPGATSLEKMIAETDDGIYIETPASWSIDDRRENFQLGGEIGWLIENGKLTSMVKNPTYSGNTVEFWNSCDALGTPEEYRIWGTPSCGKGQPGQTLATGQGAVPARFQQVKIGQD